MVHILLAVKVREQWGGYYGHYPLFFVKPVGFGLLC